MCHIFKYPQEKVWGIFFPSGDLFAYPKKPDQCSPLRKAQNWTHVPRDSVSHTCQDGNLHPDNGRLKELEKIAAVHSLLSLDRLGHFHRTETLQGTQPSVRPYSAHSLPGPCLPDL